MNPNAMFELFLEYARRIRHVLDAWLLLFLCPALTAIPWVGLPLGLLCALIGAAASLRVMKEGRLVHGLLLGGLFGLTFISLPMFKSSLREQANQASQSLLPSPVSMRSEPQQVITPFPRSSPALSQAPPQTRSIRPMDSGMIAPLVPPTESQAERASEPLPAPMPQAPAVRNIPEEARRVVQAWWDAKRQRNIDSALGLHTNPTDFCGLTVSREQLRDRLMEDWNKNAQVGEAFIRKPNVSSGDNQWKVECNVRFAMPSDQSRFPLMGQCLHTFDLADIDGRLRIARHTETITPELHASKTVNGMSNLLLRSILACCLEADVAGDIDNSMRFYAPKVRYFGQSQDAAAIRADKLRYFERWPTRSECFEGEFTISEKPGKQNEASFRSRFRTESRERGEWCEGLVEHHFTFAQSGGRPLIVVQSAKTIESRKGKLP